MFYTNIFCAKPQLEQKLTHLKTNLLDLKQKLSMLSGKLQAINQNLGVEIVTEEMLLANPTEEGTDYAKLLDRLNDYKTKIKAINLIFRCSKTTTLFDNGLQQYKNLVGILENLTKINAHHSLDFSGCKQLSKLTLDGFDKKFEFINFAGTNLEELFMYRFTTDDNALQKCLDQIKATLKNLTISSIKGITTVNLAGFAHLIDLSLEIKIKNLSLDQTKINNAQLIKGLENSKETLNKLSLANAHNITEVDLNEFGQLTSLNLSGIENKITKLNLRKTNIDNFDFAKFTALTQINLNDCAQLIGEESKNKIVDLSNSENLKFEDIRLPISTHAKIVIANKTYKEWKAKHVGTHKWDITQLFQDSAGIAIFIVKDKGDLTITEYDKTLTQHKGLDEEALKKEVAYRLQK